MRLALHNTIAVNQLWVQAGSEVRWPEDKNVDTDWYRTRIIGDPSRSSVPHVQLHQTLGSLTPNDLLLWVQLLTAPSCALTHGSHGFCLVSVCGGLSFTGTYTSQLPSHLPQATRTAVSSQHVLLRALPWPLSQISARFRRWDDVQRCLVLHTRSWRCSKDSRGFQVGETLRGSAGWR